MKHADLTISRQGNRYLLRSYLFFNRLRDYLFGPFPRSLADIELTDFTIPDEVKIGTSEFTKLSNRIHCLVWRGLHLYEEELGNTLEYHCFDDIRGYEGPHFKCPKCQNDVYLMFYDTPGGSVCKKCGYDLLSEDPLKRAVESRILEKIICHFSGV